ncbi:peroxisomal succinyl-coenzyme A thioesterase-like isoform X2 [Corythoichthys intestinalis]|uniref:peroxisomal succinyl-coenzyme A thioesterase-like isoform X2 n=1 Tax=Corythoichthys intestinalis TaxID=161448 RepID=UPI0025A64DB4|nr:peroxisomal succinyl-coenzyme A thioesterase-like isoform X2 [Corythoichthys intestinalis]
MRQRKIAAMSQSAPPPILSVAPTRALVDETLRVRVDNLPPRAPVTLRCEHRSEDKDYWEAYGHYVSDAAGAVSVADDLSLGGTYCGREAMGLLWSMRPVPGSRTGLRLRKRNVRTPMLFTISVFAGHVDRDFDGRPPLARELVERWYAAPGVRRVEVEDRGVRGTLFIPSGPGPFPGLLDMWGGGGGLLEYRSALLASHGYVSLALEYFAPGELASTDLEFQYFETAFDLVRRHPAVLPDRVGIFGLSMGAMVAISLASESARVEPACCVCISGSHFFPRDQPLSQISQPNARNVGKIRLDDQQNLIWRDLGLPVSGDLSRKADVRRINCPLLLVNGQDDQNHPTVEYAEDIERMMRSAGKEHLLTRLEYPDTGHLIEPPYSPHFRATNFMWDSKKARVTLLWGGQTKAHSDAQEDSWHKILAFLQRHLYSAPRPKARM